MPTSLLRKNRNVWRVERAGRAAMLVDGAAYFAALRESLLKAKHCIYIAGWDIDAWSARPANPMTACRTPWRNFSPPSRSAGQT